MPRKRVRPPSILRGQNISNARYSRHDAFSLAESAIALNIEFPVDEEEFVPILRVIDVIKDKNKTANDTQMDSCS